MKTNTITFLAAIATVAVTLEGPTTASAQTFTTLKTDAGLDARCKSPVSRGSKM